MPQASRTSAGAAWPGFRAASSSGRRLGCTSRWVSGSNQRIFSAAGRSHSTASSAGVKSLGARTLTSVPSIETVTRTCEPRGSTTRTRPGTAPGTRPELGTTFSPRMPASSRVRPASARTASGAGKACAPIRAHGCPSVTSAVTGRKFIGGLPMNPPTKVLTGCSYTRSGASHWTICPSRITASRSPRLSASTWSCVT